MDAKERKAKQAIVLETLGKCGSIKQACRAANVGRSTVYRWRDSNKTFAKALALASDEANDTIDDEIARRGIEGVEEPLVSMGKVVYLEKPMTDDEGKPMLDKHDKPIMVPVEQMTIRKYSDSLLLALAKSRMKKYRDRVDLDLLEQINNQTGGAISLNTKDLTGEELAQLKLLAQNIKARQESQEKR